MTNPHISVVIPCYNDGKYLPETIARLKQQTFTDFEIIVVNDGSTDESTIPIYILYLTTRKYKLFIRPMHVCQQLEIPVLNTLKEILLQP